MTVRFFLIGKLKLFSVYNYIATGINNNFIVVVKAALRMMFGLWQQLENCVYPSRAQCL